MTPFIDRTTHDRNGVPYAEYVRLVEFVDGDNVPEHHAPVHVARHILFDGRLAPARIDTNKTCTVDLSAMGGTVLTMSVHRDDVQVGRTDDDGTYVPHMIGDRLVLTPVEPGWAWEPEDPDDPSNPYLVVSIYVAEVHVRGLHKPPPREEA